MRTDYAALNATLLAGTGPLRLVAVSYLSSPPDGVERFTGTMPSGCGFWSLAARGRSFYTVPADHLNCPIGAYTHAIDPPPTHAADLEQTLSLMSSIGYVRLEEVPSIQRLSTQPAVTCYAPLEKAAVDPDVVIATGRPAPLMRLQEAAARAGAAAQLPLLGPPTCMALPAAMAHGAVMSSGCIGNRVYTGLGDDELYLMLPGNRLADIAQQLAVVAAANDTLEKYHRDRQQSLTA